MRSKLSMLFAGILMFALPGAAFAAKDLVVGVPANLTGLDPADLNDNLSQSAARLMFEGLYMLDEHMKLRPQLAESYEASEDAKEFTFHLRKGVTFQDGTSFNAEAVKFSFDRAGNPDNHLKRQSLFVMIAHTDVVDDYTVRVVLKYPFGAFVNDIAHPGALIVSPKSVQQYGKEVTRHPSGTGPYEFVSWSADTLKLKKNEHYWQAGLPKIETITYRSVPENGARIAMLQAGEAQFIYPVPPELIASLKNSPTITVFDEPSILGRYIALNNMRKPFSDPRVRLALNYAVDKQAFIKVVFNGHADPMDSPMPPLLGFYQRQGNYPYDPGKAKALLAEAGYPNGFESNADRWRRYAGAAWHAVHSAATCHCGGEGECGTAGGRCADGEGVQREGPGGCDHRHVVHRLVVFHRRRGLGHAADAAHQVVPAGACEPGMVQQSGDGCGDRGGVGDGRSEQAGDGVCQGTGAGVAGCALDLFECGSRPGGLFEEPAWGAHAS